MKSVLFFSLLISSFAFAEDVKTNLSAIESAFAAKNFSIEQVNRAPKQGPANTVEKQPSQNELSALYEKEDEKPLDLFASQEIENTPFVVGIGVNRYRVPDLIRFRKATRVQASLTIPLNH